MEALAAPTFALSREGNALRLRAEGRWEIGLIGAVDDALRDLQRPADAQTAILDLSGVSRLDTAGAWVLYRVARDMQAGGLPVTLDGVATEYEILLEQVAGGDEIGPLAPPREHALIQLVGRIGVGVIAIGREFQLLFGYLGLILLVIGRTIVHPARLRATSLVHHIEQTGLDAIPIVSLITFLIGGVVVQQGAEQLRNFGAEVFTVDLIAIIMLRELGLLLTAIVLAGRSSSAFTAEIGSMKMREELDAMRVLALDPIELLVVPRVLALMVSLPLLTFIADIVGLVGGAVMSWFVLDISPGMFLIRLNQAAGLWHFWVGIIKAPFMAFVIAAIGCMEGMKVTGTAESVGRHTTIAVVKSIFLVIIIDALFAIFFTAIGV